MYNTDYGNFNVTPGMAADVSGFLLFDQINKLKGYSFWIKLISILSFINFGGMVLVGALFSIILIGIPMLLFGIFGIYMTLKLWKAARALGYVAENNNQQSFNNNGLEFMMNVGSYYKITGILMVLSWVGSVILIILSLIFGGLTQTLKDVNQNIQTNITNEASK